MGLLDECHVFVSFCRKCFKGLQRFAIVWMKNSINQLEYIDVIFYTKDSIEIEVMGMFRFEWFAALLVTLIVEGGIAFLLLRKTKYAVAMVLLINLVTNPLMNALLARMELQHYLFGLIVLEILVVIIEGSLLNIIVKNWKKALLASLAQNSGSLLIGLALFTLIP